MTLAHPLTETAGIGAPPLSVALAAVVVVAAALVFAPVRPAAGEPARDALDDVDRPLSRARLATRLVVVAVVLFAAYAGRRGNPDGLSNIAPPLVVGVAWAALVVGSLAVRRLWSWVDPWDTVARGVERIARVGVAAPAPSATATATTATSATGRIDGDVDGATSGGADDGVVGPAGVWPMVLAALAVTHFLVVRADSTQPRAVGAALAAYTIVAVAVGVALGRRALASVDVVGATSRWAGELRDGLTARWAVPAGAEVVLGVVAGGLLLDLARRSGAYLEVLELLGVSRAASVSERTLRLSLLACAALTAGVLHAAERIAARRGGPGAVAVAVLPVVLALVVVWRLRRLLVSLQLLPIVAGDPLGRGWDLLGTRGRMLDANPFGTTAQRWTSIVLLTAGAVAGALALRRRGTPRAARDVASYPLYLLLTAAVLAVATAL